MKTKKHILFLSSWYPTRRKPFLGNFIQRQAKLLACDYKVTALHLASNINLDRIEIEIHEEENLKEIMVYHPKGKNMISKYTNMKKAFKKGVKLIEGVDLIQGNIIFSKGIQFVWAKKYFKCPLIVMEHSSFFHKKTIKDLNEQEKITLRNIVKNTDHLITVSANLKNDLAPFFPYKPTTIIPNHIDTSIFKPETFPPNTITEFLHISTLDEKSKNPLGIIHAVDNLKADGYENFHLTIVSDEPTEKWANVVAEKKLSKLISFKGPLCWEAVPMFYQQADCFILFSNYETFSIVLAESWACGIPTISTPVGIATNVESDISTTIETNNISSLSEAMKNFIENKIIFDRSKIIQHSQQFSEREVLSKYNNLLSSIFQTNSIK